MLDVAAARKARECIEEKGKFYFCIIYRHDWAEDGVDCCYVGKTTTLPFLRWHVEQGKPKWTKPKVGPGAGYEKHQALLAAAMAAGKVRSTIVYAGVFRRKDDAEAISRVLEQKMIDNLGGIGGGTLTNRVNAAKATLMDTRLGEDW